MKILATNIDTLISEIACLSFLFAHHFRIWNYNNSRTPYIAILLFQYKQQ
jgi:hypothetical protein